MKITLEFSSDSRAVLRMVAETDAEKAILAFLIEDGRTWAAGPNLGYRPYATEEVRLFEFRAPAPEQRGQ